MPPGLYGSASMTRGAVYEPAVFERQSQFEEVSFWYQGRNEVIVWALRHYFPDAASLLEVGCGTGVVLAQLQKELPGLELVGGELHEPVLEIARERMPGVEFALLDGRSLPYENRFEVVSAFDVLEHIAEDEQVLGQMHRCLRPGGGLLITVPQHPWLWSARDEYLGHERRYSRKEMVGKVEAAGFEVVRATSFVSTLLPFMLASRVGQRILRRDNDPTEELGLPASVQRVLSLGMKADLALIKRGVSLPAGGSLLVVARRG